MLLSYTAEGLPVDINRVVAELERQFPGNVELVAEDFFDYEKSKKIELFEQLEKQGKSFQHKDKLLMNIERRRLEFGPGKFVKISHEMMQEPAKATICAVYISILFEEELFEFVDEVQEVIESCIAGGMKRIKD